MALDANILLVLILALAAQNSLVESSAGILRDRGNKLVVGSVAVALDVRSLATLLLVHAGLILFLFSCGDM